MKKKTFSTSRYTFQKGLPMGNLVSVDLKLVHRNRSVIIAHISTWIKLRKVLSWENFLWTGSSFNKSIFSGRAFVNKSKAPLQAFKSQVLLNVSLPNCGLLFQTETKIWLITSLYKLRPP